MASCYTFGQTLVTDLKTPMNSPVPHTYELGDGMTSTDKANLSDSVAIRYPDATEVNPPSATYHYNCHSFAWYRSEGGNRNVWIGWTGGGTAEDVYWDDGSFIKVSSLSDATKISYDNDGKGDHSAIKLFGTNCRSKWGPWPLVDHAVDYGPDIYNMSIREYYAPFKVNGPQLVCSGSTATFTTPDYVDCTFNWTYNTNLLDYVSGQGTKTFVVKPKYSYSQGQAWVKLELTIDLDDDVTREITKNVWVGIPTNDNIEFGVFQQPPPNDQVPILHGADIGVGSNTDAMSQGVTGYIWDFMSWSPYITGYQEYMGYDNGSALICLTTSAPSQQIVRVSAVNACGSDDLMGKVKMFYAVDPFKLLFSPNPTTGETTLTIESASKQKTFDETAEWDLEVYSETHLLKTKQTGLRGQIAKIQTAGWKEGVYLVRVNYNDEVLTGKLLVKR